jgi:hypothetical protein
MKYSVESLEFLKQKSNITYDAAVELLKKYDGDVALAIVDLEKQGKLKVEPATKQTKQKTEKGDGWLSRLFRKLMAHRLVIKKEDLVIANISWLFIIISILTAPWLVFFAFIASMILGYKYTRSVNWSINNKDIKDFGNQAVATIKGLTNKILEEEPSQASVKTTNKEASVATATPKQSKQVEDAVKAAEKLSQEVVDKGAETMEAAEIIIE